ELRQRRLAGAGRAEKDQRAEAVGFEHAVQQLAFAQEVLLADELLERAGPHPRGQRLRRLEMLGFLMVEKSRHGVSVVWSKSVARILKPCFSIGNLSCTG